MESYFKNENNYFFFLLRIRQFLSLESETSASGFQIKILIRCVRWYRLTIFIQSPSDQMQLFLNLFLNERNFTPNYIGGNHSGHLSNEPMF